MNYKAIKGHLHENIEYISNWENDLHRYALLQVAATGMCNKTIIKSKFKINIRCLGPSGRVPSSRPISTAEGIFNKTINKINK